MKELTVVLPALKTPWEIVEQKVINLAKALEASLNIVVQAHSPALKRSYFFPSSASIDARKHYRRAVATWCETLRQKLSKAGREHAIEIIWKREISGYFEASPPPDGNLLVLVSPTANVEQDYRTVIRNVRTPILVLGDRPWGATMATVAAVDPVHEDDIPMARDTAVVESAMRLSSALSAKIHLVHSCFIPPYLADHRREILFHHNANVRDFIADGKFSDLDYRLINGDPAVTLRAYIKDNHIALLALGSVVRGLFDRTAIGSTTESFLAKLPCDLLLVHS